MSDRNLTLGVFCAVFILIIWSGFIVVNRAGVLGGLTPYDLAASRFILAGALTLPFAWAWWPRHLPWYAQVFLPLCGPGVIYSVLVPAGLANSSAAYGGVFTNGALPILTMLIAFVAIGAKPTRSHIIGSAVIIAGSVLVTWRGLNEGGSDLVTGITLFLIASLVVALFIYAIQHWQVKPRQALALVNAPNALIFLPIWAFFLPSTMAEAPMDMVIFQILFQGLGPGFLAMIVFTTMAFHLGPTRTAAVSAAVPASAALLAIPALGEVPSPLEWVGIATVTLGLMVVSLRR